MNTAKPAFRTIGKGADVRVASGPRGVDVLYLTKGRYVVRRYANGRLGAATAVSEAGVPIFGSLVQDDAGRVHAAWIGARGLPTSIVHRDVGRG